MKNIQALVTLDVLGPLSERELKFAPRVLHVMGDVGIMRSTTRVAMHGRMRW